MLITPDPDPFTGIPAGSGILLAFSGGIDSSAAAWLCARAGFRVFPVYLRMNPADPPEGPERMRRTAEALGLSVTVLDCVERFREEVMHLCCRIFESGRTPNPCVLCNPLFKFGFLREYALKTGCAAMATGHYVRRNRGAEGRGPVLFRGADPAKDQSYFLYGLSEEQLDFSCFPLGNMTKDRCGPSSASWIFPTFRRRRVRMSASSRPENRPGNICTAFSIVRTGPDASSI